MMVRGTLGLLAELTGTYLVLRMCAQPTREPFRTIVNFTATLAVWIWRARSLCSEDGEF